MATCQVPPTDWFLHSPNLASFFLAFESNTIISLYLISLR